MPLLTKEEFDLFEKLCNLSQENMRLVMLDYLKQKYERVVEDTAFIYAVGDIPVALVAHMDTVFEESEKDRTYTYNGKSYTRPKRVVELYYDQWKEVLTSPVGSGFDDRAGIYAIYKIIQSGRKPSIILTTDEEIGGVGAKKFVNKIKKPLSDLRYIIQLDRRGIEDCVFYDLDSPEFQTYIESFGFKTNYGSFSDISTICPAWKIAGVNLSIGYENEHSVEEILRVQGWFNTIEKVKDMLDESDIPFWEYKAYIPLNNYPYADEYKWYNYNYGYGYTDFEDEYYVNCAGCGLEFDIFDTVPALDANGKNIYYCCNCQNKYGNCANCGEAFLRKKPEWKFCKSCSKEMRKTWKIRKKK